MPDFPISKSLSTTCRKAIVEKQSFDIFKKQLQTFYEQIENIDTEEKLKGDLMDFLKQTFYGQDYKVSPNGRIDCAIHLGKSIETPVGVIFEVKMPSNAAEMITRENLNKKALQEVLLYYLRERVGKKNIQLKQLVVTNIYEFFIFDAKEFEQIFYSNKKLLKRFSEFSEGTLTSDKTDFFYKEIASEIIETVKDQISYTWFDIRNYKKYLSGDNDKKLLELYKVFSPVHLLKKRAKTDSNTLNTKFYSELLHIIGLEEVEDKNSHKRIITRKDASRRNPASLLENTITVLDSEDWIDNLPDRSSYGHTRGEQLINVALSLSICWINRILFLKLLEAQIIKYHKGDEAYAFLCPGFIPDYDELNKLFFQVLAKRTEDRSNSINEKYARIPYLNSSLFEIGGLERRTIRISSLDNSELPLYSGTVLKDGQKQLYKQLPTLRYLLEFLDAYDFSSDGSEQNSENTDTLINASVLGLIFEKINGHKDGAVFTPGAVTMYMSREIVRAAVVSKFNESMNWNCKDYDALKDKDIEDLSAANDIVDSIRICDPAVGSGHFLVSLLNEIIRTKYDLGILLDCNGKRIKKQDWSIDIDNDELIVTDSDGEPFVYNPGNAESRRIQEALFNEKRKIIENCLYGVDINQNAVNICSLRLWIELLKNAYYTEESQYSELETLPNIDINIKTGNSLIHKFDINQDISEIIGKANISIAQYREAVSRYKNAHSKEKKRELENIISSIKDTLREYIAEQDPKLKKKRELEKDLNKLLAPRLFEITKKEQKQQEKQEQSLRKKIEKLSAEIEDIKANKIFKNSFEWRIEFPEILDEDGRFIGFDCIIGNPPYIQLQKMGTEADALQKMKYEAFERTGDIYCLFYEMGLKLLKPNGILSFVTSNKWMRAGYGKSLRTLLSEKYNTTLLIDFSGYQVFDSATVDVNILNIEKTNPSGATLACSIQKNEFDINKLSDYIQHNTSAADFSTSEAWVILTPIELSIKRKIEAIGVPLKDWDIKIYRGILTGCNDAFIISSEKRAEILANCTSPEEQERTDALIRPILRGRDIKRYGYDWADLWLINTHNGIKGKFDRIHIEDYPALKAHLDQYIDVISSRADKGDTPYNLRNCAYMEEFSKPKIVWGNLNLRGAYSYAPEGVFINAPSPFISTSDIALLHILNSKVADYYIRSLGITRNGGYFEYKPMFVDKLPIPKHGIEKLNIFPAQPTNSQEVEIEDIVYQLYGLSEQEINYIENQKS